MLLNRQCHVICGGPNSPLCGAERIIRPGLTIWVTSLWWMAPQVGGYKFTKVLMDGGSSINILYYETFRRMGLTDKDLKLSNTIFHGVVLGNRHIQLAR